MLSFEQVMFAFKLAQTLRLCLNLGSILISFFLVMRIPLRVSIHQRMSHWKSDSRSLSAFTLGANGVSCKGFSLIASPLLAGYPSGLNSSALNRLCYEWLFDHDFLIRAMPIQINHIIPVTPNRSRNSESAQKRVTTPIAPFTSVNTVRDLDSRP